MRDEPLNLKYRVKCEPCRFVWECVVVLALDPHERLTKSVPHLRSTTDSHETEHLTLTIRLAHAPDNEGQA